MFKLLSSVSLEFAIYLAVLWMKRSWLPHKNKWAFARTPAKAFLFIDERSDSIDDGYFAISLMPPSWQNVPAWWHHRGDV